MPLYASGFFVPTSPSIPYVLEDIYLRGGYRSVADVAARNAVPRAARKQGMLVYVRDEKVIYTFEGTSTIDDAWTVWDVTKYVNLKFDEPLAVDKDFNVTIEGKRILPVIDKTQGGLLLSYDQDGVPTWIEFDALPDQQAGNVGDVLLLDDQKVAVWGKVKALPDSSGATKGSALVIGDNGPTWGTVAKAGREEIVNSVRLIGSGATETAKIPIPSKTNMVLKLKLSIPNIKVELHSTLELNDKNPYTFQSTTNHLEDDGTTILEDGTVEYSRRYGFYVNQGDDVYMYVRYTNMGQGEVLPELRMTLLPLE